SVGRPKCGSGPSRGECLTQDGEPSPSARDQSCRAAVVSWGMAVSSIETGLAPQAPPATSRSGASGRLAPVTITASTRLARELARRHDQAQVDAGRKA